MFIRRNFNDGIQSPFPHHHSGGLQPMTKPIYSMMALIMTSIFAFHGYADTSVQIPVRDVPFRQASSVKYKLSDKMAGAQLKKVVVDYRDNVYVLTDQGVCRDFPGNVVAKDYAYASLADLVPVDICIQEETGYLYYLYPDQFLTNAHAGTIYGKFPQGSYQRILVNSNDEILLLGETSAALFLRNEKIADIPVPNEPCVQFLASGKDFYCLSANTLYRLSEKQWKPIHKGRNMTACVIGKDRIHIGTGDGYYSINFSGEVLEPLNNRLPVPAITDMILAGNALWFGTENGAFLKEGDRFRYFAWKRWLDQNTIKDMAFSSDGNVFLLTETGLNEIRYVTQTLAEKAATVQKDLEKYHIRFGWSVAATFVDPNDPTTLSLRDDDNDGLWTSIYLGSQAFRYAVTGEETARRNVWESFEAFERNLTIHNVPGFSARTFERKGFAGGKPWRDATEEDWVWKGTTSTDEVVGYIFIVAAMDQFICKTPEERKRIATYLDTILTHVIENDYYMVDYDGKPTLWARWHPDHVNKFSKTQFDRKLNSVLITAMLQLGYKLTGKEIYKIEALRILEEWGYLDNMLTPMANIRHTVGFQHEGITMGEDWNHSDDEMAFLTYWVLCQTAFNEDLQKIYDWIVVDHWEIERSERNALWNIIPYSLTGVIDLESVIWWLREFNLDRTRYRMTNSHRNDIERLPDDLEQNFRAQRTKELLTQGEIPMMRHNSNGFALDGGSDFGGRLTGEEFLLPYWMCRYYGVLK